MRLSRPEKRDAMSPTLNRRMMEVLDENEFREDVGVLVLTGEDTSWTAGMDLKEYFRETEKDGLEGVRKARELRLVAAPALVSEANRREPEKSGAGLDAYSTRALSRIWKAERFSWWMTTMPRTFTEDDAFGRRVHDAELAYTLSSVAARAALAENYVGLPYWGAGR